MNSSAVEASISSELPCGRSLTVADAVWVGMAILQKGAGDDRGFDAGIISTTVESLQITKGARQSILQHVTQHCVGNREPQPNRSCMLFATEGNQRRLFRSGDRPHPAREGAPTHPEWSHLPASCGELRRWYEEVWNAAATKIANDPLLQAIGIGRHLWANQHADEYLAELRGEWERQ